MTTNQRAVLHIDDDPQFLRLIGQKLEIWGYQSAQAMSPTEGIWKLQKENYRVVLLDVDMPESDGIEVLEEIKAFDGGIEVIMLTGIHTMSTILRSQRRGAEACLFKPVHDFSKLKTVIESTFAKQERWWDCLRELQDRRTKEKTLQAATSSEVN